MKFNTSKQKLPKLWEKSKKNSTKVINQTNTNQQIRVSVEKLSTLLHSQQKFVDLSQDWSSLDTLSEDSNGNVIFAWKNWSFRLPLVNEDIANSIFYDVLVRFGNGLQQSVSNGTAFRQGMIIDRKLESGIDSVNVNISFIGQRNTGLQGNIQVKLVLLILNPNLYYKQ